jgi:hypothetical protein
MWHESSQWLVVSWSISSFPLYTWNGRMIEIDFRIFGLAQPPNRWFYCLANECWFGLYASLICSHPMKPSSSNTASAGPSFSNRPPTLLGTAGRTARGPNRTLAHFVGPKMGQFTSLCPNDGNFHEVISHRILGYPIFRQPPGDWEMICWYRYPSLFKGGSQTWPAAISVRIYSEHGVEQNLIGSTRVIWVELAWREQPPKSEY